jgi:hypothetical protein
MHNENHRIVSIQCEEFVHPQGVEQEPQNDLVQEGKVVQGEGMFQPIACTDVAADWELFKGSPPINPCPDQSPSHRLCWIANYTQMIEMVDMKEISC